MSGGTVGAGVTIDVLSRGTLKLSGTVANSGMLIADGAGSTIVISGVVSSGATEINNGIVNITKSSSEDVIFTATGSGGLELAAASSYTGTVSGFGGGSHTERQPVHRSHRCQIQFKRTQQLLGRRPDHHQRHQDGGDDRYEWKLRDVELPPPCRQRRERHHHH